MTRQRNRTFSSCRRCWTFRSPAKWTRPPGTLIQEAYEEALAENNNGEEAYGDLLDVTYINRTISMTEQSYARATAARRWTDAISLHVRAGMAAQEKC